MKREQKPLARIVRRSMTAAVLLPILLGVAHAQSSAPKAAIPVKNLSRTVQPFENHSSLLTGSFRNDSPFGINRKFVAGGARQGDGGNSGGLDEVDPAELMLSLSWTRCEWHRSVSGEPTEAILQGEMTTTVPVVWSLSNAENPGSLLTSLPCLEGVTGRPGDGMSIALDWEYRMDGGVWNPLLPQQDAGFVIPVSAGMHSIEVRVTGMLPWATDDGYYRLTLNHEVTPLL